MRSRRLKPGPDPESYRADLAFVHDAGFGELARRATPELIERLRLGGISGDGLVVELGCGSGISAERFVRAGYDVLGVDVSRAMLSLARRRVPSARFVRASLHELEIPPCQAVVALGEAIAYVPVRGRAPSLARLFAKVARALPPGGLFVFDLISKSGPPLASRGFRSADDWAVLSETRERGAKLERHITTFRRKGALFQRSVELHAQRLVDPAEIARMLRRAGFRVSRGDAYGKVKLLPRRVAFIALKR